VNTTEEILGRKNRGFGLENEEYGHRDPLGCPCSTPYPQKLALTLPASGGHSVGIVSSWTQAMEFTFLVLFSLYSTVIL
jgi:hypothetical protein